MQDSDHDAVEKAEEPVQLCSAEPDIQKLFVQHHLGEVSDFFFVTMHSTQTKILMALERYFNRYFYTYNSYNHGAIYNHTGSTS